MHRIGSAKPERERLVRKLFFRALALFLVLFLADGMIVGWLFFLNFDQRFISNKVAESQRSANLLAGSLESEMAPGGALDYYRLTERQQVVGRLIDQYTAQLRVVKFVEILDSAGRPLLRRIVGGGLVGFARTGSFNGKAPASPDTAPAFPGAAEPGQLFSLTTRPHTIQWVSAKLGKSNGTLHLALANDELLPEERGALLRKLLFGGGMSLVLLGVAFLYVLRLAQRTRRLEAEAQRAEQLAYLGTLASGLAHEIRNPLNAMNINLQMLEEELGQERVPGETVELLRSSRSEVLRLERLVKDFLAFARPKPAQREELAPGSLVADVVRFVRPLFQERKVALEQRDEPGTPTVLIDPSQIRQALLNIMQNALEASRPGSSVTLTVGATDQGEARIDVSDHGPGIDAKSQILIFQVFWSGKPAGSGLGLPIAQRLVESHGGRIELDSEVGVGSTFRIILPSAIVAAAQPVLTNGENA